MNGHPHRITTAPESATDLALEQAAGEAVGLRAVAESQAEDLATMREMIAILFEHVAFFAERLAVYYAREAEAADRRARCTCRDDLGHGYDGAYHVCRHCRPPTWPVYLGEARARVRGELDDWLSGRQRERAA